VLAWVKANLVIVIALAVAILAIPVALFLSSKMNSKLRATVQQDVSGAMGQLNSLSVDYTIPSVTPGQEEWTIRSAPNQLLNDAVEQKLRMLTSESEEVRALAENRNRAGKKLLVSGSSPQETLFPAPPNESVRVRLLTEMVEKWPAAHAAMLADARAGAPPDPAELLTNLESRRARLVNEIVSRRVNQELDAEEKTAIATQLAEERLGAYKNQAHRITFYADPSVFVDVQPWPAERGVPRLEQAWEWQWITWIDQDIVAALAKANSGRGVSWVPVDEAPVKRIVSIKIDPFGATGDGSQADSSRGRARGGGGEEGEESASVGSSDPNATIVADYSVSPTGRVGWPIAPNGLYDLRYATVTIIADANRIPVILDAIASTNFMSVVDLDIRDYDGQADLAEGYYYGPHPVVEATIRIESVWLRSWMKPWIPDPVRTLLGIPPDEPAASPEEEPPTDA